MAKNVVDLDLTDEERPVTDAVVDWTDLLPPRRA